MTTHLTSETTHHQGASKATYRISGFRLELYVPPPQWEGCIFEQDDQHDVTLSFLDFVVSSKEEFQDFLRITAIRVQRLVLALELKLGHRLVLSRISASSPIFDGNDGNPVIEEGFVVSSSCDALIVYAPAPTAMPQAPLAAKRWIKTFAEAGDFTNHVEEQLRRHYLVIEELWSTYSHQFGDGDHDLIGKIKLVRDFVSHPLCTSQKVVGYVSGHLPGAVVTGSSPLTVRFDREDQAHLAFVARHEVDSGRLARSLVELAIGDLSVTP